MAHLTSVFRDESNSAPWTKLKDNDAYSLLHSKYWGNKIDEEAREWRELQPTVEVDRTHDIGPGCYGLHLGVELRDSELWVRQDYIRIYDYCSQRYEEGPTTTSERPRSVVITGQPGVGVFLSSGFLCI
jgi:hypothetical protein